MTKEYTGVTYTKPGDMYKCYELAKLLKPDITVEAYRGLIDKITKSTNYVQHVVLCDGEPVSMCATQDNLNMSVAPLLSCKIDNIATLPEHRGAVTRFLLEATKEKFQALDYDNFNLCVHKGNDRAEGFYKSVGFEQRSNTWMLKIQNETPRARL
jgi:ribosomal protein S18 acetylase RimI-like enzyme